VTHRKARLLIFSDQNQPDQKSVGINLHPEVVEKNGERGRNRTVNLLIKSHVGLSIHFLATHNNPITYTSLARTENLFEMLEMLAIFGNVQPQLQPHLRQPIVGAAQCKMARCRATAFRVWFCTRLRVSAEGADISSIAPKGAVRRDRCQKKTGKPCARLFIARK
jgi:hypothetical protein